MSSGEWKIQVISAVSNFLNRRNVFCGLTLVVLNAIAWPSFVVWIVIDIGLAFLLILPWILQLTKKKSTRVDIMFPGNVKDLQGGFGSAMSEAFDSHLRNSEDSRVRSSSRRTRYNHEFSRCTPDERDNRTPFPRMSAIKNRLSYSTAEASIRSATPTSFSPSSKNTLQERSRTLHNPPRPAHHNYTPSDTVSSSVLHIARSNLPVAREVRSPVVVKVAPLGTSPRISLVEAKHEDETSRRDDVVNALKQITQKRKRVYPLSDNKDDENSFLDSLPSVKKSRQEPAAQQALKRTWTKTITNESFSKAPMPETKKHKTSSNVTKEPPSLVRESMVIPPPAKMSRVEENQKAKDMEEAKSSTPLIEEEVTQILNTSDKENESLDKTKLSTEQKDKAPSVVIKKLRTVYPSSKPSLDARRRKYPILCSSGVAPKLGRQSSKLKYEDYVKDREDAYARVKQVLEEVDKAESQNQKKKEEKPITTSEPAGLPSDAVKNVSSVLPVPQITTAPTESGVSGTEILLSISSTASASSTIAPPPNPVSNTTAPPPNVVISSNMSQSRPTSASSSGQLPSIVFPTATSAKPTNKSAEMSSAVNSSNSTIPKMPSLVGTTSQTFGFSLPNAQLTGNSSNSQVKQPTLNFSMPVSATSASSTLGIGTAPGISSSQGGKGLGLPSTSVTGFPLQLPTTTTTPSITPNTVQLTTNMTGANVKFSLSSKPPSFPALVATTTNAVDAMASYSSAGSMEVASVPQSSSILGTTFNSNLSASTKQSSGKSAYNFNGLFASSTSASSLGYNSAIASSVSGSQFKNLFGNPQATTINTGTTNFATTTTTSGQPFVFSVFPSSQTTAVSSNHIQFSGQMSQPNNNSNITVSGTSSLFNQPQTQSSSNGFNFMANTANSTPNFSFNLQPSVGGANISSQASNSGFNFMANTAQSTPNFSFNLQPSAGGSSLFPNPPGGFNLPSTAPAQPRRRTKTPTRSKQKRK